MTRFSTGAPGPRSTCLWPTTSERCCGAQRKPVDRHSPSFVTGKPVASAGTKGLSEETSRGRFAEFHELRERLGLEKKGARATLPGFGNAAGRECGESNTDLRTASYIVALRRICRTLSEFGTKDFFET